MGNQAQVDSSDNPSALTNDPVFSNLHNAFQLGWSIIELKSRIQIAALSTTITGTPQAVSNTASTSSSEGQTGQTFQSVLSNVEDAKKKLLLPETQQNLTALPDSAWLTSLWRATFNRIVESHKCCFPNGSSTNGTLYNLPDPPDTSQPGIYQALVQNHQLYDASKMYLSYLYLYPINEQAYADVGIQLQQDPKLTGFGLYDVTRRTINCLTLLYTNSAESLIPYTVNDFQIKLVQNVINYSQLDKNKTTQTQQLLVNMATLPFNQQISSAIQLLSNNAINFLESWDAYARETLYVSGGNANQADEIQLVAYEAGRAMASLSWGITTTIVPIENALNTISPTNQDAKNDQGLQQHLANTWLNVFDDRSIASIQQQISALSTAMDDAYYRVHPDIPRPNPNDLTEQTNLALPSQTIQAVTFSLDYWKRAVKKICNDESQQQNPTSALSGNKAQKTQNNRPAGTQPASTSISPPIPKMPSQTSSYLRLALVQQAEIWQPLLLHQQSLLDFTTQYVTQRILNDFMNDCEKAAGQEIQNQIKKYRTPLIIGGGVILVLLISLVILLMRFPDSYQALASAFALLIGGIVGFFGTVVTRFGSVFSPSSSSVNAAQASANPISAITGLAGDALVEAFQNGYKQIMIDFDYLNHNVSITYPLVEFFMSQSLASQATPEPAILIKDAYEFLTQIAWTNQDRANEIGQIARAAFGPIGAFIGAQLSLTSAQNNK